jgi:CRP/FNR family cyclic AMP-dependent transcriptional regulator
MSVHGLDVVLKEHPFLEGLDPEYLLLLTGCARNARFAEGEYLWREGETADNFFLVRAGQVALEIYVPQRGELRVETVGEGEVLGWSWMLKPYKWHFDARAVSEVRAVEIDARCIRKKAQEDKAFGYEFLMRFSKVMQERLEATRLRVLDLYAK